jgi:uncharacterized protein YprB with RNaseH-like and TPR domain
MPPNLRARLLRIRNAKGASSPALNQSAIPDTKPGGAAEPKLRALREENKTSSEWHEAGYKVLCRTLTLPFALPAVLPKTLSWLLPDLSRHQSDNAALPKPEKFMFFDLETTGLSGGAGTVAFLAAFGRFVAGKRQANYTGLELTQFLLLDYPGEADFIESVLSFITAQDSVNPYFLCTYNGKAFDVPLLKTRCLMNGFSVPQFYQLDLLHPARRLWKRLLPNCSQATVETLVLGLDRGGDTPGAMAPDIWFNFLRSGDDFLGNETDAGRALLGICDHNVKDIFGLASLFRAFAEIAGSPLDAAACFNVDEENLAMCWRHNAARKQNTAEEKTAILLLETAAQNYPRASLRLGFDHFRKSNYAEGRAVLKRLTAKTAWKVPCTPVVEAMSLRSLAIDAERRLGRKDMALAYLEKALSLAASLPAGLREDLEKRFPHLY